jgi:hypothetical protein
MKNGLYSIHIALLDGRVGKGSGVLMFRDGKILGGDAYLFYTGSYFTKEDGTFRGEVLIQPAVRQFGIGGNRRYRNIH